MHHVGTNLVTNPFTSHITQPKWKLAMEPRDDPDPFLRMRRDTGKGTFYL